MFKYSLKAFDTIGDLVFSAIIPQEKLFDFLNEYSKEFTLKAYIIDDEETTRSNV